MGELGRSWCGGVQHWPFTAVLLSPSVPLSLNFSLSSTSSSVQLEQPVLQASFWILQYQNDGHREVGQGTGWVGQGLGLQAKDSLLRGVVVDVQELLTW